jgi:hypothetical protein
MQDYRPVKVLTGFNSTTTAGDLLRLIRKVEQEESAKAYGRQQYAKEKSGK